ncbi:hypothetical protein EDB84DRAFT_679868 [Lactarius hengduanensis]|nr:hypothetical protein EDB84DRAFT_679868 [Lactarius hengduanensis]
MRTRLVDNLGPTSILALPTLLMLLKRLLPTGLLSWVHTPQYKRIQRKSVHSRRAALAKKKQYIYIPSIYLRRGADIRDDKWVTIGGWSQKLVSSEETHKNLNPPPAARKCGVVGNRGGVHHHIRPISGARTGRLSGADWANGVPRSL